MRYFRDSVKVGIMAVIVVAVSYWAFSLVTKGTGCFQSSEGLELNAYFRDAALLIPRSRVMISGVAIGSVTGRELTTILPRAELVAAKRFAKIKITFDRGVKIFADAKIFKRAVSLLGGFRLDVDPGSPSAGALSQGGEIKNVIELATMPKVVDRVMQLLPEFKRLVESLREFSEGPLKAIGITIHSGIDENRAAIKEIVRNLQLITRSAGSLSESVKDDIQAIVSDIRPIIQKIRSFIGSQKNEKNVVETLENIKDATKEIAGASSALSDLTTSANNIVKRVESGKGTVGKLFQEEDLVDDIGESVSQLRNVIEGFTSIQTTVSVRSEYNFQAGNIKSYVSVEIRPRPDKFFLLEVVNDPRGWSKRSTRIVRTDDPNQPSVIRDNIVDISHGMALGFSFQLAKQIGFATFRIGIKENTGGVGIDLSHFDDSLKFSVDAFDMYASKFPRLKLTAAWRVFPGFYLVGGADDVLNVRGGEDLVRGRDFFAGASLNFDDRDLRNLLLIGGSAISGSAKK